MRNKYLLVEFFYLRREINKFHKNQRIPLVPSPQLVGALIVIEVEELPKKIRPYKPLKPTLRRCSQRSYAAEAGGSAPSPRLFYAPAALLPVRTKHPFFHRKLLIAQWGGLYNVGDSRV